VARQAIAAERQGSTRVSDWIGRVIGVLLMLSAVGFALSRAPDRPVQTLVARWALPPSEFADLGGMIVHYRDEGPRSDRAPLVLLHGTGSSLHTWQGWVRALQAQRRVITVDLPGFGLTGPHEGVWEGRPYDAETDADFVLALLDELKVQRFSVGGNSLGGEVAWRLAARVPQRVERLILVSAAGPAFKPLQVPPGFLLARTPVLNRIGDVLLPRALVAASLASMYGDPSLVREEQVDRHFELTLREGNRRALAERLAAWAPGLDAERIATLRLPTLILWGGRDRLIPPSVGQTFEAQIPGSRLLVFDDLGHVPQEEDPARTAAVAREFLSAP
jgi:pimeloyl-ACP methyl ester carboxylesterase